jgi:hypothetical protein
MKSIRTLWCAIFMVMVVSSWSFAVIHDRAPVTVFDPLARSGGTNEALSTGCSGNDGDVHGRSPLDATYQVGTTWYDMQHNGSGGRMIAVDELGFVHMVWMKGMNSANSPRHVYYNVFDPSTESFLQAGGVQIDNSTRAGYVNCDVLPAGWCFPTFHYYTNPSDNSLALSGVAIDYGPGAGIFNSSRPTRLESMQILWPKIAIGHDSTIHMVAIESPADVNQYWERVYYARGNPVWDAQGNGLRVDWDNVGGGSQQLRCIDTLKMISPVIVQSPVSNRLAIVMTRTRVAPGTRIDSAYIQDNDIMMYISEDGGNNWGPRINVTNFAWADYDCPSGDTAVCDRDTFRTYYDCAALFDMNDHLHVAFSTIKYWSIEGTYGPVFSDIWHWDEQYQEFCPVARAVVTDTIDWTSNYAGVGQLMVQRPTLALDPVTGFLYCTYQWFDSLHTSQGGYAQGDAMVAMSRNGGRQWSVSMNLTQSGHDGNPAPGQCHSELGITCAEHVTYENGRGYLHVEYVDDLDAGICIRTTPEGVCTNNSVYYMRLPVDTIPAYPLQDWTFPVMHADSTGMPGRVFPLDPVDDHAQLSNPASFKLYQNYPNPFNPTTNIQFDMPRSARVSLTVYNVLGEQVATLFSNKSLNAGVQTVAFDASALASGVYIYRLDVAGVSLARKMVLMK